MTLAWISLILASITETFWGLAMKQIHIRFSIQLLIGIILLSVVNITLLSWSMKSIPTGVAYTVWTGLGIIGICVGSSYFYKEIITSRQIFFFALIIIGIIGLKVFPD